ncbi:nitroreductase family protein [Aquibacillus sediminis]|uniref:nitroreductase family protein n=1 Tax=Aquibacillus sediminis TaxID=2574734 RepID=UPI00110883B0|nr:nitroreductase family protein [Aquibacillus sediminis]
MGITNAKQIRKADYPVDPVFIERWSPRSFLEKEIPEETFMGVLEAARWAPSSLNKQPWRFIVARNKQDRERFLSFINEGNQVWCEKAPAFVLVVSDQDNGASHSFDAGAAWGNLSIQAAKSGLITHAMGGFDKEKARTVVNIPDNYELHAVIAIGYQGEKQALPEQIQEREQPSDRRPLQESIFEGKME